MAIDTSIDLVGSSGRAVVTPQATEQLAGAFRSGLVSAQDIMERVSERTRKKQELELVTAQQGIAEAQDPQLIEAKRNTQLAAGAQAGTALALNPLMEQAKTAELKAAIFDAQAKPGGFDLMQTALSKAGFPVSVDPNIGLTDANKNEIIKRFSALQTYTLKRADAEDRVKSTETKFFPTEQKSPDGSTVKGQLQKLFRSGQEITSDDFKSSVTEAEALKRTPFSQWYSLQATTPGQVVAPATPAPAVPAVPAVVISPIEAGKQRAQLINQGVPNAGAMSDQEVAAMIQPRAAAPVAAPPMIVPTLGQTAPGLGIVTGVEAAPTPAVGRPTEGQQRALLAVPRFQEANAALQDLQARNYDPTSWGSWVASYMPQIIKSGDRKEFEMATSAWAQGLLRLESGAAITPKEEGWYSSTFFPIVNDPPNVVAQKAALRKSVEAMVSEIGVAGNISEDIQQRVRLLRNSLPGGATPAVGTPAIPAFSNVPLPATPSTENTAVVAGRTYKVRIDPATGQKKYFIVQ